MKNVDDYVFILGTASQGMSAVEDILKQKGAEYYYAALIIDDVAVRCTEGNAHQASVAIDPEMPEAIMEGYDFAEWFNRSGESLYIEGGHNATPVLIDCDMVPNLDFSDYRPVYLNSQLGSIVDQLNAFLAK